MIALDTSSLAAFLEGLAGRDVEAVDRALADGVGVLPPVVLSELLSNPRLTETAGEVFRGLPLLPVVDGFWDRAGLLRRRILAKQRRARLAHTLIAQACLDADVPLVTRDPDFRHFAAEGGLKLL